MAWTTPGTATAGEVLTAAFWNLQVRDNIAQLRADAVDFKGLIGETGNTSGYGPTSGGTSLDLMSVTITANASYRYRAVYTLQLTGTNATDIFAIRLQTGATSLGEHRWSCERNGIQQTVSGFFAYLEPSAGSTTYKLTLTRLSGSGTASVLSGVNSLLTINGVGLRP